MDSQIFRRPEKLFKSLENQRSDVNPYLIQDYKYFMKSEIHGTIFKKTLLISPFYSILSDSYH